MALLAQISSLSLLELEKKSNTPAETSKEAENLSSVDDHQRRAVEIILNSDEISRPTEPNNLQLLPTDRL